MALREFSNLPDPMPPPQTKEIIFEFNYRNATQVKMKSSGKEMYVILLFCFLKNNGNMFADL